MKTAFSTASVHARDRLAYWLEEASKHYVTHEFSTPVGRKFNGEIRVATLGTFDVAAFRCDEAKVVRTPRCLKGATDDDILLCQQVAGHTTVHQDGRDVITTPGDVYLIDPRRPFALGVGVTRSLVFKVPRWELQARLGEVASHTAMPVPRGKPVSILASEFLTMAAERADAIDPSMGAKVARQALDLVALAFEARTGNAALLSSTRTTTLLRLKSIIEARLSDPELKPAGVAAIAGISVRYANALLAQRGYLARALHRAAPAAALPPGAGGSRAARPHRGRHRLFVRVFRSLALHAALQGPVRTLARRVPPGGALRGRGPRSLLPRAPADKPHEGLDLGAIMILIGARYEPVLHLHHHAKAAIEHLAALAVPVHELDLEADGVAVGGQLERAVEDVLEILAHLSQRGADPLAPDGLAAVRKGFAGDMQRIDRILGEVTDRLVDVALGPCCVESVDRLNRGGVPQ